jgi:hypothetical protein
VASLHASAAHAALADVNAKLAYHDAWDRKFFLILGRDPRLAHRTAAGRARARQRRLVALSNASRASTAGLWPILGARFPSGPSRMAGQRFREGGGLAMRRTARSVQLPLQTLVLAPQSLVLPLQALAFSVFVVAFPFHALDALAQVFSRIRLLTVVARALLRHATFMADSRKKYKYGILNPARRDRLRFTTR